MKQRITIDFDGVIHDYSEGFQDGRCYGKPIDGVKGSIDNLRKNYEIVICTARLWSGHKDLDFDMREEIEGWLKKHEIYYDILTNEKIPSEIYIDDRAYKFRSWAGFNLSMRFDKLLDKG